MKQTRFLGKALLALFICAPFGWAGDHHEKSKDKQNTSHSAEHGKHSSQATHGQNTGTASRGSGESGPMVGMSDRKFMTKAAQGGMAEVQLGQLAQQKGSSEAVKEFGRTLEKDHSAANEKLKMIAKERSVELPTDLDAEQQKTISMFNNLSGEEFDRQFVRHQLNHHRKDIREFEKASRSSMDSDLREFASGTLPALKTHYEKAQEIQGQTRSRRK